MSAEDYGYLSNLANECLVNRRTVQILESNNRFLSDKVKALKAELVELKEKCKPYLEALKATPKKVKDFIDGILKSLLRTAPEQEKSIFHKPPEKKHTSLLLGNCKYRHENQNRKRRRILNDDRCDLS